MLIAGDEVWRRTHMRLEEEYLYCTALPGLRRICQ